MNIVDLENMVLMHRDVSANPTPLDQKKASIKALIPQAVNEVILSHDWDFACSEAEESTVADQADYVLKGNNKDCRDIINIRYGDDDTLLDKMLPIDYDEFMRDRTQTAVAFWVPIGHEYGHPKIKIVGTPDAADEVITYRYRRKGVGISEFPDEFGFVLVSAVVKRMMPEYIGVYQNDLSFMKDKYAPPGGEDRPAPLDPLMVTRNNSRARKFGWT